MTSRSRLGFHEGEALCRVASAYPTVLNVILEQIQNAIDANATTISVVLQRKTRHIAIRDDGDGVSKDDFERSLVEVCHSQKTSGKLGRFGIGLISPLDKCEYSTFISCPRDVKDGYMEWTFVTNDIRAQRNEVEIPHRSRRELFFLSKKGGPVPKGKKSVMWRTEINIHGYSTDRLISRIKSIDTLAEAILERFSAAMRRKNVSLNLKFTDENGVSESRENIKAKLFTGRSLGEWSIIDESAGRVTFRLFLAPKTTQGFSGSVNVGEADNDYRFGFKLFARSVEGLIPKNVLDALSSGTFEGEIVAQKVKLDVTRTRFEKDDAFVGFCTAIESWFLSQGSKHLDAARESQREHRYQVLGLESLEAIEHMLKNPMFREIQHIMNSFNSGSVGKGHAPSTDNPVGVQSEKSLSTRGTHGAGSGEDALTSTRSPVPTEDPTHQPYTAAGPRGKQRAVVQKGSRGLQFSYIAMDGSDKLWELDAKEGVLHFNLNHPTWVVCDGSDLKVRQLQETVTIQALVVHAMPVDLADTVRFAFDEALHPFVYLFHNSPSFNYLRKSQAKE